MKHLIKNIGTLVTGTSQNQYKSGAEMAKMDQLHDAWLLVENDKIKMFGKAGSEPAAKEVTDASGGVVLPSWCDSHTHLVFASSREGEFIDRMKGLSYEEIAKRGGGILNSAKKLQSTSEEELYKSALERANEIAGMGTGAVEIKSGYGLTLKDEIKMLRVAKKIKQNTDLEVRTTFLGAHALPEEFKSNRERYIDLIVEEMIPRVSEEKLADYCDVFCDRGFFTPEETDRILVAAAQYGLPPKIHANELGLTGGIQVGVANKALSVDHLEHTGDEEIELLKGSGTMPTLLPSTAFFLGLHYPPARKMIDSGLPVALATDYNPGSSPSGNMWFILSLASIKMKMLPEEALNAATINSAYAMGVEKTNGSLAPGKTASFIITKPLPSLAFIPYSFGSNLVSKVMLKGKFI